MEAWIRYISPLGPGVAATDYIMQGQAQQLDDRTGAAARSEAERQAQFNERWNRLITNVAVVIGIILLIALVYYIIKWVL